MLGEHGQLQLQGLCSTGTLGTLGGWLVLLPCAELTQELSKGILHPWTALLPPLCQEVTLGAFSWLSQGDGELSALSSCPGVGNRGHGCCSHPALLFPLPQGTASSLQDPSGWPSPR